MTLTHDLRAAAPVTTGDPLVAHLRSLGGRPALVGRQARTTYAELADRVEAEAEAYAGGRRLVLLTPRNDVASVVAYLAAHAARQVVLLCGEDSADALRAAYDPDVDVGPAGRTFRRGGPGAAGEPASPDSAHDLHPDLALLLSTSGSTGSPKLVRLSRANLLANARGIVDALGIRPDDVAATTLPMHYCYGLSVVHSHLLAGAALCLTDDSVLDESFWADVATHRVTSIAGVPHTFELLDRSGFAHRDLPSLRVLTQAGGRMPPARVRDYAALGERRGFRLFVMYGQTEATARMAVLDPRLAGSAAGAVGTPLPGTHFTLAPAGHPEPDVGELVFHGPNVMLGYAETPADLARGRTVTELRTGDLGRQRADGLWEVVGRTRRVAKVLGLRVDLDRVEALLAERGVVGAVADGGDRLVVAVCSGARPVDEPRVLRLAAATSGLPPAALEVRALPDLPRLPTGKVDHAALVGSGPAAPTVPLPVRVDGAAVAGLYADVLGRPDARPDQSFVDLGGDSLSYVEASIRLERLLGDLPAGWPTTAAEELAAGPAAPPASSASSASPASSAAPSAAGRRRTTLLETNVVLRALAIVTIVGTHANLFTLVGGAHVLLAVAGFNVGRFQVTDRPRAARVRSVLRAALRVAVPSVLVISVVAALTDAIGWRQAALLTAFTEWRWSEPRWSYWFIEALVGSLLVLALLLAVPLVDRLSRRHPFGLPVGLLVAVLPLRYDLLGIPGDHMHRVHGVLWLLLLGWATATARTTRQRLLLSVLAVALTPGFFAVGWRPVYLVVGLLLLVWLPHLRVPTPLARVVGVLAAASLWTYLLHWQVYPHLEDSLPLAATVLSLLVGVAAWWLVGRLPGPRVRRWLSPAAAALRTARVRPRGNR